MWCAVVDSYVVCWCVLLVAFASLQRLPLHTPAYVEHMTIKYVTGGIGAECWTSLIVTVWAKERLQS